MSAASELQAGWWALARVIAGFPGQPRLWAADAACAEVGTAVFLSDRVEVQAGAVTVCTGCPVRAQCRTDGLAFERRSWRSRTAPVGVLGGLTSGQRRVLYRAELSEQRERVAGQVELFSFADLAAARVSIVEREVA
ncbi:MAG: WhiB family transcriptional regulator [Sciscionella sp.]